MNKYIRGSILVGHHCKHRSHGTCDGAYPEPESYVSTRCSVSDSGHITQWQGPVSGAVAQAAAEHRQLLTPATQLTAEQKQAGAGAGDVDKILNLQMQF